MGVTSGVLRKKSFMTYCSYLVRKTPTSSYLLRIQIPRDLREYFGRNQFKISLNSGIHSQSSFFAKVLHFEVQSIFSSIRMGTISKITVNRSKTYSVTRLKGLSVIQNILLLILIHLLNLKLKIKLKKSMVRKGY